MTVIDRPIDKAPVTKARRFSRKPLATAAVVVLIGALIALSATLGWKLHQRSQIDEAAREALDTARTYAVTLTSIDTGALEQNFTAVLDGATGEFKDMYSQSSTQLRQLLLDNQAAGHGTVVDAAVKSATRDRVEVLLFIDQSVTNTANPDPRIDRSRVSMTMERVDGRWLASNVDLP